MVTVAPTEAFVARLRDVGEHRYHDKHPFHRRLVAGELSRDEVRSWVANRFYYQKAIPIKDAYVLAGLPTREHRRAWIVRIVDHDGTLEHGGGGTEKWLALARAVGLDEDEVTSESRVAPGTRFAVDAYVDFARRKPWLEAVASSLTELFGPPVMAARVKAIVANYPWIDPAALAYFDDRAISAPRDAELALSWVVSEAKTPEQHDACVAALRFKCDVLWCILDATAAAVRA